jgi:hypothetical protein
MMASTHRPLRHFSISHGTYAFAIPTSSDRFDVFIMLAVLGLVHRLPRLATPKPKLATMMMQRIPAALLLSVGSIFLTPTAEAFVNQGLPSSASVFQHHNQKIHGSTSKSFVRLAAQDVYIPPDFSVDDDQDSSSSDQKSASSLKESSTRASSYSAPSKSPPASKRSDDVVLDNGAADKVVNTKADQKSPGTGSYVMGEKEPSPSRRENRKASVEGGASWMDRNAEFSRQMPPEDNSNDYEQRPERQGRRGDDHDYHESDDDGGDDDGWGKPKRGSDYQNRGGPGQRRGAGDRGGKPGNDSSRQNNRDDDFERGSGNDFDRPGRGGDRGTQRRGQRGGGGDAYPRRSFTDGGNDNDNRTFRQDFRGTRVFVQGLPPDATWQNLKDHFRVAGEVVFASVSTDRQTGESKCCGVVQYETTEMARHAIDNMRNFPLDGFKLYVREDVQEREGSQLNSSVPQKKGPTPPSTWLCANEENAGHLSEDERMAIRSLIKARDGARFRKQYDASDNMREELKQEFGVHVDDRLKMWWTSVDGGETVPQKIHDAKGTGRWEDPKSWRQIPTTPENDACVNPDLVNGLLTQRDISRREKDFSTADALLIEARDAPDGDLSLRIHDESRTWRIWTEAPPPKPIRHQREEIDEKSAGEQCISLTKEFAPHKLEEVENLLEKFPGREFGILKKLKQRYLGNK